jgi:hypothetical protein
MADWDDDIFRHEGGRIAFFDRLVEIIEYPSKLEEIAEEEIRKLKLERIPSYPFVCD